MCLEHLYPWSHEISSDLGPQVSESHRTTTGRIHLSTRSQRCRTKQRGSRVRAAQCLAIRERQGEKRAGLLRHGARQRVVSDRKRTRRSALDASDLIRTRS